MVYILDEKEANLKKYIKYLNFYRKIYLKRFEDKYFCIVKIKENISYKKLKKIEKKILKKLYSLKESTVTVSNKLSEISLLQEEFKTLNILNGRWLFNYILVDVIIHILETKNLNIENTEISILSNNLTDTNLQNILRLSDKLKNLNILTDRIQTFKQIKEKLLEEKGIMLRVTNNKRKALLKSIIIINLDFSEEAINSCTLPNSAIIINVNKKVQIKTKTFNGINVNHYLLEVPNEFKINGFNNELAYESLIYSRTSYENIIKRIKSDNISIKSLIGNNGIIDEKEFKSCKLL